jgi:N-acetyl-beta-hexosaminidase
MNIKKLKILATESLQKTIQSYKYQLKLEKGKNKMLQKRIDIMKQERSKDMESLEKRVEILTQQIKIQKNENEKKIAIERIEHENSIATENMLRQFLNEKIRKMEETAEKGGVEELKKIVFNNI